MDDGAPRDGGGRRGPATCRRLPVAALLRSQGLNAIALQRRQCAETSLELRHSVGDARQQVDAGISDIGSWQVGLLHQEIELRTGAPALGLCHARQKLRRAGWQASRLRYKRLLPGS